jgi:hypothetical protein
LYEEKGNDRSVYSGGVFVFSILFYSVSDQVREPFLSDLGAWRLLLSGDGGGAAL